MGHFLLIFFVARYLRKTLTNEPGFNEWDEKLKYAMIISIVAFGASVPLHDSILMEWVADVVMLFCIYILYTRPFFKTAKSILLALAPYAIVSILVGTIKLVLTSFYKSEQSVFDSLEVFAVLWGVFVGIQLANHCRHLHGLAAYLHARKSVGMSGRIQYEHWLSLRLSSVDFFCFGLLFLILFLFWGHLFALGASVGCLLLALRQLIDSIKKRKSLPESET